MRVTKPVLALVAILALYNIALACRCRPNEPSADISRYAAVFSGKVTKVTFTQPPNEVGRYRVTFEVERVWKGDVKRELTLITRTSSCDFRFREDESYLVYAFPLFDESGLTTHKCSNKQACACRRRFASPRRRKNSRSRKDIKSGSFNGRSITSKVYACLNIRRVLCANHHQKHTIRQFGYKRWVAEE